MRNAYLLLLAACTLILVAACTPVPAVDDAPRATPTAQPPTEPPPSPTETPLPEVLQPVLSFLDSEYGIEGGEIQVTKLEEVEWPNSCLGAPRVDEGCLEVITPGELIVLKTPQGAFEFHTDATGQNFRLVKGPSGIQGEAVVGPVCPVVVQGTECPDQPFETTITVLDSRGEQVTQVKTDPEGKFSILLKPGTYTLSPQKFIPYPRIGDQEVVVEAGSITQVLVQYDSGIR